MLTADQILSSEDRKPVPVEVPEWGGTVYLREMSGADMESWYDEAVGDKKSENRVAAYLVRCLCTEDGKPLFSNKQAGELAKKSTRVQQRLFRKAQELNGLGKEGKD